MPWNLRLEAYTCVGEDANLYNFAQITLGTHSVVSQRTFLCTGTHDYTDPQLPLTWAPITIGPNAWVCAEAFVGPGVTIGEGAVIGARSVVTRDMPEWTVSAGNPCKPIKPRVMREPAEE